jgi:hypothetical protein
MLALKLDPGAYRLISWQRTCDPNCGNLDPAQHPMRTALHDAAA